MNIGMIIKWNIKSLINKNLKYLEIYKLLEAKQKTVKIKCQRYLMEKFKVLKKIHN